MSYIKILVHAVWGTKHRQPVMINGRREILQKHIYENACRKKTHINCIGGYHEHLHLLLSLNGSHSVAETIGLIKGESSFGQTNLVCLKIDLNGRRIILRYQ